MKITASNTQAIQQKIGIITDVPLNNKAIENKNTPSFVERLNSGLDQVANTKMKQHNWQKILS